MTTFFSLPASIVCACGHTVQFDQAKDAKEFRAMALTGLRFRCLNPSCPRRGVKFSIRMATIEASP